MNAIMKKLNAAKILTKHGNRWHENRIAEILRNEKYIGDALLQKKFTVDFLTKTMKVNEGEVPQYYVENSHPAIIDRETFDLVQSEMKKRRPNRRQAGSRYCVMVSSSDNLSSLANCRQI